MSEPLCPMTPDGRHKRRPWHDRKAKRSGLACVKCHKTWAFKDGQLVPTYQDQPR